MFDFEKFNQEHCRLCGSQRCMGVNDTEMRMGCNKFKRAVAQSEISLSDMAEYCKSINIDCDICIYKEKCEQMLRDIEDISPYGLIKYVKENKKL